MHVQLEAEMEPSGQDAGAARAVVVGGAYPADGTQCVIPRVAQAGARVDGARRCARLGGACGDRRAARTVAVGRAQRAAA
eukprot:762433-Hanusia_phi.AAC.24